METTPTHWFHSVTHTRTDRRNDIVGRGEDDRELAPKRQAPIMSSTPSKGKGKGVAKQRSPSGTSSSGVKQRLRSAAADGTLDALFAKSKAAAAPASKILPDEGTTKPVPTEEPPVAAKPAAVQLTAPAPIVQLTTPELEVLKRFDLNMAWGPMAGPSRLMRWERAKRLNLEPPEHVKTILLKLSDEHPEMWSCWQKRV